MKSISIRQALNQQKTVVHKKELQKTSKTHQIQKKHTFSDLITELKQFFKSVLSIEVHLEKALRIVDNLKEKYQRDIFSVYQTNLKMKSFDGKKSQKYQNNIKISLNQQNKNNPQNIEFLPLQSALLKKQASKYKITLNGHLLEDEMNKNIGIKSKKTLDTDKSSEQCQQDRQLLRWKSNDDKKISLKGIKSPVSQKKIEFLKQQNQKVVKGINYIHS